MSKEMNKLQKRITKYNIICGLFMSLIIGLIFNLQIAVIFFIGMLVGLIGYISRAIVVKKWIGRGTFQILITTFIRICLIVALIFPIIYDFKLVISYLVGFMMNFLIEGFCIKI